MHLVNEKEFVDNLANCKNGTAEFNSLYDGTKNILLSHLISDVANIIVAYAQEVISVDYVIVKNLLRIGLINNIYFTVKYGEHVFIFSSDFFDNGTLLTYTSRKNKLFQRMDDFGIYKTLDIEMKYELYIGSKDKVLAAFAKNNNIEYYYKKNELKEDRNDYVVDGNYIISQKNLARYRITHIDVMCKIVTVMSIIKKYMYENLSKKIGK